MLTKKIGWIGTGLMGLPMAHHLVSVGYTVLVNNRTKSKAQSLLDAGCQWCETPEELAQKCDVIITIIGYPKDVEEVYFGKKGIFEGIKPKTILVDMTTTKPSLAVAISERAQQFQSTFIDAPISGGELGAINGNLSIMMGGDKNSVDALTPLFEVFGENIKYQGKAGAGQHTKMCNQITVAGTMIGVCESLLYAQKAGLNMDTMLQSISKGAAACWTLDVLAPKIAKNDFAPGFMVEHFIKDLGIALEEAETMQLSLPGLALAQKLYLSVSSLGQGRSGTQALYLALEKLSSS